MFTEAEQMLCSGKLLPDQTSICKRNFMTSEATMAVVGSALVLR